MLTRLKLVTSINTNLALVYSVLLIFLVGKRACLGESLSKQELFIIFTRLMQKFKIVASEEHPMPSQKGVQGIIHAPLPFYAKFISRNDAI